jgi:hypothetical protein
MNRCSLPGVWHIVLTERVWVDDLFGSDRGVQARQRVSLHRSSSPRRMRCRHRQIASALDKDARASWAGASLDHDNSEARRSWTELTDSRVTACPARAGGGLRNNMVGSESVLSRAKGLGRSRPRGKNCKGPPAEGLAVLADWPTRENNGSSGCRATGMPNQRVCQHRARWSRSAPSSDAPCHLVLFTVGFNQSRPSREDSGRWAT